MTTPIRPMLAATTTIEKVTFPMVAQFKYDGFRCVVGSDLIPKTRTLKNIGNLHIRSMLSCKVYEGYDGEIVTFTDGKLDPLDVIQSKVSSADGKPVFKFFVFDRIDMPGVGYMTRYDAIAHKSHFHERVEHKLVQNRKSLSRFEDEAVSNGWEGVILRKPDAPYKYGRSTEREAALLKIKRFLDDEAEIVDFVQMEMNGNEAEIDERGYTKRSSSVDGKIPIDSLGALILNWNGKRIRIGSGFRSDAQRELIWNNKGSFLGKKVTFKYQRLGPNGLPLLPIFKALRDESDII